MELRILGWESKGMRCPDASLSFNLGDKTDFIQMNNGTGKTTILILLQIALTGIRDVEKITEGMSSNTDEELNRSAHGLLEENSDIGSFKLHTKISGDVYTFAIVINRAIYGIDAIKISSTSPNKESGGISINKKEGTPTWNPPADARVYLTLAFVQVFIFNGEKAEKLFTKNDTAKKTIDALCQFNILDESKNAVSGYVDNVGETTGTGTGNQANETRLKTKKEKYVVRRKKCLDELKDEKKGHSEKKKRLEKLDQLNKEEILKNKDRQAEQEKYDTDTKENDGKMLDAQKIFYGQLLNPMKISNKIKKQLVAFRESLTKCKLPEDVAKQWFTELSDQPECICGHKIGPQEKKKIRETAKDYLDDRVSGILNSIKGSIEDYRSSSVDKLNNSIKSINEADNKAQQLQTSHSRFLTTIGENNEEFKLSLEEMGVLKKEIKDHEILIKDYEAPGSVEDFREMKDPEDLQSIKTLDNIINKIQGDIDSVSRTTGLRDASKLFIEIIEATRTRASKVIYENIKSAVQKDIDKILIDANPPIRIVDIESRIKLNRDRVSEGQQLATAYIFILSALKNSNIKVPFIVDSPCGSIDGVKRKAIGSSIPLATDQFITFITDTERANFVSSIKNITKDKCSFTTIFWKGPDVDKWIKDFNIPQKEVEMHDTWGMVKGFKSFNKYNLAGKDE